MAKRTKKAATAAPTREYSRAFAPKPGEATGTFNLAGVPRSLLDAAREKANREGISLRSLLLRRLHDYIVLPSLDAACPVCDTGKRFPKADADRRVEIVDNSIALYCAACDRCLQA